MVQDNRSGARRTLAARALFVFIGAQANTDPFSASSRSLPSYPTLRGRVSEAEPGMALQILRFPRTPELRFRALLTEGATWQVEVGEFGRSSLEHCAK